MFICNENKWSPVDSKTMVEGRLFRTIQGYHVTTYHPLRQLLDDKYVWNYETLIVGSQLQLYRQPLRIPDKSSEHFLHGVLIGAGYADSVFNTFERLQRVSRDRRIQQIDPIDEEMYTSLIRPYFTSTKILHPTKLLTAPLDVISGFLSGCFAALCLFPDQPDVVLSDIYQQTFASSTTFSKDSAAGGEHKTAHHMALPIPPVSMLNQRARRELRMLDFQMDNLLILQRCFHAIGVYCEVLENYRPRFETLVMTPIGNGLSEPRITTIRPKAVLIVPVSEYGNIFNALQLHPYQMTQLQKFSSKICTTENLVTVNHTPVIVKTAVVEENSSLVIDLNCFKMKQD